MGTEGIPAPRRNRGQDVCRPHLHPVPGNDGGELDEDLAALVDAGLIELTFRGGEPAYRTTEPATVG